MTAWGISAYNHPTAHGLAIAQRADQLGLDVMWVGEHLFSPQDYNSKHPYRPNANPPVVASSNDFSDMFVFMGAVLATTHRLRFATGVHVMPLRHPLLTARALTTADEIGRGRIILGVGAGWMQEEFDALDVPFAQRGARLDEAMAVLRDALDGVTAFDGQFYRYSPLVVTAERVDVPLVIGGSTKRALRRAARSGDGWYGQTTLLMEDCLRIREDLEALRREYGTADRPFFYAVRINPHEPEAAERYEAEGFDQLILEGEKVWPRTSPLSLEEKLGLLEETIDTFGLRRRLAEAALQAGQRV